MTTSTDGIHLHRRGHAQYVLRHGREEIGRMRGHRLRLHGFGADDEARAAALAARDALAQWYRERERLGHDADVTPWGDTVGIPDAERLVVGGVVVGRMLAAADDSAAHDAAPGDHVDASFGTGPGGRAGAPAGFDLALPHTLLHALTAHLIRRLHAATAPWRGRPHTEPAADVASTTAAAHALHAGTAPGTA